MNNNTTQLQYDHYPLEIFDNVAYYLTTKQKGICQSVCRSWRKLFTPSQYRHIHVRGRRQFSQFYQSLEPGFVGHYVRRLSVNDVYMTAHELNSLPMLCPNLIALSFNGKSMDQSLEQEQQLEEYASFAPWSHLRRLTELQDLTVTNYLLKCPCSPLSSLTHLSIRLNDNDQSTTKIDFFASLHKATDLVNLSLDSVSLSLSDIETIHQACPHLQKLRLVNVHLEPIGSTVQEKRAVATYLCQPAKFMRTFEYQNGGDLYDCYEWLYYFANKYMYMENLELWCEYSVDTPHRVPPSASDLEERYGALARLGMTCRSLKSIKFLNITMNYWIFEALDSMGTQLESIALGDMTDNTIDMLQYLGESRQNVSSLILWGWPSLCIQETMEETIAMIGQCSERLSSLVFSMRFSGIKNSPVPIDMLLKYCSNLSYLKLDGTQAALLSSTDMARDALVNNPSSFVRPKLNHLVLENGSFLNELFEYLSIRCPNLTKLEIGSCALIGECSQMEVKVNMPHHAFDMISISHIRPPTRYHHNTVPGDIRLFDVSLSNANTTRKNSHQLYELTDYEKYADSLTFHYEQKPLETNRPTKYILHSNPDDRPAGPFVSIQCQNLTELNIGNFWVI
ncbi:hypothetical protein HMPREF1544_08835 [Mucor circinelloides 1006PhL]|uniref:F-box domain-containing protein n=1 Tax=Mucor circinelloides f. circinelloides (strain 1006PhL) TaxID=1220926 RepID=S2JP87_MUCC1|nr:hypothetical protein HMPREF1544_08835 [Mucor circinelloides 1006PhL]